MCQAQPGTRCDNKVSAGLDAAESTLNELRSTQLPANASADEKREHSERLNAAFRDYQTALKERDATPNGIAALEAQVADLEAAVADATWFDEADVTESALEAARERLEEARRFREWQTLTSHRATQYRKNLADLPPEAKGPLAHRLAALSEEKTAFKTASKAARDAQKARDKDHAKALKAAQRTQELRDRYTVLRAEEDIALDAYQSKVDAVAAQVALSEEAQAVLSQGRSFPKGGIEAAVDRATGLTPQDRMDLMRIHSNAEPLRAKAARAVDRTSVAAAAHRDHADKVEDPIWKSLNASEQAARIATRTAEAREEKLQQATQAYHLRMAWAGEGNKMVDLVRAGSLNEAYDWPTDKGYIYMAPSNGFPHGRMELIFRDNDNELHATNGARVTDDPRMPGDIAFDRREKKVVFSAA